MFSKNENKHNLAYNKLLIGPSMVFAELIY